MGKRLGLKKVKKRNRRGGPGRVMPVLLDQAVEKDLLVRRKLRRLTNNGGGEDRDLRDMPLLKEYEEGTSRKTECNLRRRAHISFEKTNGTFRGGVSHPGGDQGEAR